MTIDPSLYQHRCPALKTIRGLRFAVTGASQLLAATLQVVGDVGDLRTKLQTISAFSRMLTGLDIDSPASSLGQVRDGICAAVMDAWTTCSAYAADAEVSQALFYFLATNETALVRDQEKKSSGWLVPTLVVLGVAGALAGGGYYLYKKQLKRKFAERKPLLKGRAMSRNRGLTSPDEAIAGSDVDRARFDQEDPFVEFVESALDGMSRADVLESFGPLVDEGLADAMVIEADERGVSLPYHRAISLVRTILRGSRLANVPMSNKYVSEYKKRGKKA